MKRIDEAVTSDQTNEIGNIIKKYSLGQEYLSNSQNQIEDIIRDRVDAQLSADQSDYNKDMAEKDKKEQEKLESLKNQLTSKFNHDLAEERKRVAGEIFQKINGTLNNVRCRLNSKTVFCIDKEKLDKITEEYIQSQV